MVRRLLLYLYVLDIPFSVPVPFCSFHRFLIQEVFAALQASLFHSPVIYFFLRFSLHVVVVAQVLEFSKHCFAARHEHLPNLMCNAVIYALCGGSWELADLAAPDRIDDVYLFPYDRSLITSGYVSLVFLASQCLNQIW